MITTVISPVAALSYFPHQEPRFLIPLLLPLVFLYGQVLADRKTLMRAWWLLNGVCVLFYGFIHQAGLYPVTSHLTPRVQAGHSLHLVTSHVYNLPMSLFLHRNTREVYGSGSSKYMLPRSLILYEMGSASPSTVLRRLGVIQQVKAIQSGRTFTAKSKLEPHFYLILPLSKEPEVNFLLENSGASFTLVNERTFYPHISTEALPDLFHLPCTSDSCSDLFSLSVFFDYISNIFKSCGLGLYKVNYNDTGNVIKKNILVENV